MPRAPWWRRLMESFSALLALCAVNSPVTGEFPSQRPVTRSFDSFFDLHLNKRLSKQSRRQWFEAPSRSSWRHCNAQATTKNVVKQHDSLDSLLFNGISWTSIRIRIVKHWNIITKPRLKISTESKMLLRFLKLIQRGKGHYNDVIMSAMVYQFTSLTIVYSTVYSGADQNIKAPRHWPLWPVYSLHRGTVTRKMFPSIQPIHGQNDGSHFESIVPEIQGCIWI